ncbi:MAG: serine hydrolase domain-containing protein [Actinomycetota bacterium]
MNIAAEADSLQALLDDLRKKHGVPGASLGVLVDGEVKTAVSGVTNVDTQVPVTTDTLFQIGSATKSFTATLIMQLVDEGKLGLDQQVADVIPDLHFGPDEDGRTATVRELLAHTTGMVGDEFGNFPESDDWGRGDEAVERYVATCGSLPRLAPRGEVFSYANAGYIVLGRVIEILREKSFARALHDHLLIPLGCRHSGALTEEIIMHAVAVGHTPDPLDLKSVVLAPVWALPYAYAPAGSQLSCSASDVLKFARFHLDEGVAEDGTRLLSQESALAMREAQIDLPQLAPGFLSGWGLGFFTYTWGGSSGFGHNGDTLGQHCEFRMFPEKNIAFVLQGNGGLGLIPFAEEVTREVLGDLAGIAVPKLEPKPVEQDLNRIVGRYETPVVLIEAKAEGDQLLVSVTPQGSAAKLSTIPPLDSVALEPLQEGSFQLELMGITTPITFFDFDENDRARYVHLGARVVPRVA